ncbi:MAG: hypothetical protein P4L51_10220 [Puia sp.]|nr:hypothetical protein [Puia sp.]
MHTDEQIYPFGKTLLTGVFAGIVATVICLFYNILYRDATGFTLSEIINVSSLIFGVNIVFLVIGLIYSVLQRFFKMSTLIFVTVFVLITLFCLWQAAGVHRSADYEVSEQFRGLLSGVIVIMGICSALLMPFLFHYKKFEEFLF